MSSAPVVSIVGGSETAHIPRSMTAGWIKDGRLRDFLGLLTICAASFDFDVCHFV